MSKLSSFDKKSKITQAKKTKEVINFMDGKSFEPSPLEKLKLIANSSIFGEPSYYRPSKISNKSFLSKNDIFYTDSADTTEAIFEKAIDAALDFDYKGTLDFAVELRNEYLMRLNPAVIIVRAVIHQNRLSFNDKYPGYLSTIIKNIIVRPDDVTNQFNYYVYLNKSKNKLQTIFKRTWSKYLSGLSAYHISKYKVNAKLIDLVRISHAHSVLLDELMTTGTVVTTDAEKTWENFRSDGKTWAEILKLTHVPHMALLRNLRNIFSEITDMKEVRVILDNLVKGVKKGKQFPFRYYSAYRMLEQADLKNKSIILDGVNLCIEEAIKYNPKMEGRTISLCDNSGSAWNALNTTHKDGKVLNGTKIAEIGNLSGVITAKNSDDGYVGVFGDKLEIIPVLKSDSVFTNLKSVNAIGKTVGADTENGLWLFFRDAINNKEHWDNIFIYSDMQAGHGGLYGKDPSEYKDYLFGGRNIDLIKLIKKYRKEVNPKVNIISVQVAGYDNSLIPENLYRGAILSGWTGRETEFAFHMNKRWNEIESSLN